MSFPGATPTITCRPALPLDTPRMLELTRHIWNGDDYIPSVWSDWLADPHGLLAAAEWGDRLVGLGKLTLLSPQQWWLEGLRVHPEFEGRGFASHIQDYLMAAWIQSAEADGKTSVLRLETNIQRHKVHSLCEHRGFHNLGQYSPYSMDPQHASNAPVLPAAFTPMSLEDIPQALTQAPAGTLMDMGWRYASACPELLATAIQAGRAWWWRERAAWLTTWEEDDDDGATCFISTFTAAPEVLARSLADFQQLAAALGYPHAGWFAPLRPHVLAALEQTGFHRNWDGAVSLFEKFHTPGMV